MPSLLPFEYGDGVCAALMAAMDADEPIAVVWELQHNGQYLAHDVRPVGERPDPPEDGVGTWKALCRVVPIGPEDS